MRNWRCGSVAGSAIRRRRARDGGVVSMSTVSERPTRLVAASRASRACSAWIAIVSAVTCAVTAGLPSPSPPIQLPMRRKVGSAVALGQAPRAGVLFGESSAVEVAGERARHLLRATEPPRGGELFGLAFVPVVVAGTDDKTSQFLDVPQQVCAAVIGDDLPEHPAQQADVAPQRLGDLLPRGLPGLRQSGSTETMYSSESTSASSDASMMLLEHPTVVHRFVPLPDSTRTRVVAAVPASPFRMRTL